MNENLFAQIDLAIAEGFCRNNDLEDGIALYDKVLTKYPELQKEFNQEFINSIRELSHTFFTEQKWTNALIQYKRLLLHSSLLPEECRNLAICLIELNQKKASIEFLQKYKELSDNKGKTYAELGDIFYFKLNMAEEAIKYFEKSIEYNNENPLVFNTLSHIYAEFYQDQYLDKQVEYIEKALKIQPNNKIYLFNAAFIHNHAKNFDKANEYYKKLLKLNPSYNDLFHYGAFLIENGKLNEGLKYLKYRFLKEEENGNKIYPTILPDSTRLTSLEQLKDKNLLVYHEQGFGDSIMFARFLKEIKNYAKKVFFVVPEKLYDLFKNSNLGVEICHDNTDLTTLDYDFHTPLMDLPIFLNTDTDSIPYTDGYLTVNEEKVKYFGEKLINKNSKLKIGIAYKGNPKAGTTNRDIPLYEFYTLCNIPNVEIYSFQVDDTNNELSELPPNVNIINLGKHFNNFEETSATLKNMDMFISSDNVMLNLAGALGIKTFGLYNKFAEYRWFKLSGNDCGWYNSVKPIQAKTSDDFEEVITRVVLEIRKVLLSI